MTSSLQTMPASMALDKPATAAEIRAQVNLIQEVMVAVMQDGTHYGTIPGTDKPTLYKAGSEKILSTFRIGVDPIVEDLSTPDEARYRVRARGFNQATDTTLGFGVGECSSNEEKYCWRGAVCDAEWDETAVDRRRKKWKRGGDEPYQVAQVRTVSADVANTVLKMAKKRAQIDLTLTVTGASDVFTQDIEDLPEELREAGDGDAKPKKTMQAPQRKSDATKTTAAGGDRIVGKVLETFKGKSGEKNGQPWQKWGIKLDDQKVYSTFKESEKVVADEAKRTGEQVAIEYKTSQYGRDIMKIAIVEKAAAAPAADNTPVPDANPEPGSNG